MTIAKGGPAHGILDGGKCSMCALPITIPNELIVEFCRRNDIRKLSLFGSVLTARFRPESDVDMLVEFEDGARPTLLTMARLERELSEMMGRKVDLRTAGDLSRYFRDEVVATALPQYERS
jgi:predicted nucleotidyltransferase